MLVSAQAFRVSKYKDDKDDKEKDKHDKDKDKHGGHGGHGGHGDNDDDCDDDNDGGHGGHGNDDDDDEGHNGGHGGNNGGHGGNHNDDDCKCVCPTVCSETKYECGESKAVNDAWVAARLKVRIAGGSGQEEIDAARKAAIKAGVDNETLACISFRVGVATGYETCAIINELVQFLFSRGVNENKAQKLVDAAVLARYPWYGTYEQTCGDRPKCH